MGVSPTPYIARPGLHSDLRITLPCRRWFAHSGLSFIASILGEPQNQKHYFYLPSLILCFFKVSPHDPALSKTDATTTGCCFYHLPRYTRASLPTVQLVNHLVILLPHLHVMPSHKYWFSKLSCVPSVMLQHSWKPSEMTEEQQSSLNRGLLYQKIFNCVVWWTGKLQHVKPRKVQLLAQFHHQGAEVSQTTSEGFLFFFTFTAFHQHSKRLLRALLSALMVPVSVQCPWWFGFWCSLMPTCGCWAVSFCQFISEAWLPLKSIYSLCL